MGFGPSVKFPEKGLGTMAAIWPSTERVECSALCGLKHVIYMKIIKEDKFQFHMDFRECTH
jgi:hypothetical protein